MSEMILDYPTRRYDEKEITISGEINRILDKKANDTSPT